MVFSSTIFLHLFLPATLLFYFCVPWIAVKNIVLLVASLIFYAWGEPIYIVLMLISIFVNYVCGIWIHERTKKKKNSKLLLLSAVILNLVILFFFKYSGFAVRTLSYLLGVSLKIPEVRLPIGISFYTFQGMSYVIDVYRDRFTSSEDSLVQKNPINLALYISMFPQLIAGPIVRYADIHKSLTKRSHSIEKFATGAEIFIIGLAKKVIFANTLGSAADSITASGLSQISALQAWFSALFYMLQIYYDFSGYSDMAVGLGKMFGFEFPKNFNYPYISKSITEFWRRWHISLSTWFRDYLYIPLGGNRRGNVYVNLSIVFLATGIWHGADWSFVIWGAWHGAFMLIERVISKRNHCINSPTKTQSILGWIYTMIVVYLGWVVFRMADWAGSISFFKVMFGIVRPEFVPFNLSWYVNSRTLFIFIVAIICCIPWKNTIKNSLPKFDELLAHPICLLTKRISLLVLLIFCFMFITNSTYNPFIYFRF